MQATSSKHDKDRPGIYVVRLGLGSLFSSSFQASWDGLASGEKKATPPMIAIVSRYSRIDECSASHPSTFVIKATRAPSSPSVAQAKTQAQPQSNMRWQHPISARNQKQDIPHRQLFEPRLYCGAVQLTRRSKMSACRTGRSEVTCVIRNSASAAPQPASSKTTQILSGRSSTGVLLF